MNQSKVQLYQAPTEGSDIRGPGSRFVAEAEDGTIVMRDIAKGQVAVNFRLFPPTGYPQWVVGEIADVRSYLIRNDWKTALIALDRWIDRKKKPVTLLARWLRMRPAELEGALTELDLELVRKAHKR